MYQAAEPHIVWYAWCIATLHYMLGLELPTKITMTAMIRMPIFIIVMA